MPRTQKRPPVQATGKQPAAYRPDLAYIHDAGFGGFAENAAPWLLAQLRDHGLTDGLVIDLGCGSGIWARMLSMAGYGVLGYDISKAMVDMARTRVPAGEFHARPLLDAPLRRCVAVTAIGEIFNYRFDKRNTPQRLAGMFRRVYEALHDGGLFVFDVATPGRVPEGTRRAYTEGPDWACLYEAAEDAGNRSLVRRITTFRKVGQHYRRDSEVHQLRLYEPKQLSAMLCDAGFRARLVRDYGKTKFPPGYVGFIAQKPPQ
jgi:SAM-dependent methyltransferase